jgi:hypothetical protein
MTRRSPLEWLWWRELLASYHLDCYVTPRLISIDIWQLALAHRGIQCSVLVYIVYSLLADNAWAVTETPQGSFNAWFETGSTFKSETDVADYATAFPYCASTIKFADGPDFVYDNPSCMFMGKDQMSEKTPNNMFLTTLTQDTEELHWPCAEARPCAGGTLTARANGQCTCTVRSVKYPVGVEDLWLALEHSYATSERFGRISGSSNNGRAEDQHKWLDSVVEFRNGTAVAFSPSMRNTAIRLSVRDWLHAAGMDDLDFENSEVRADYRRARNSRSATLGHAGMVPASMTSGMTVCMLHIPSYLHTFIPSYLHTCIPACLHT